MVSEGFKQTEVGLVPQNWAVVNLGDNFILKARIGWQGLTTSEYLTNGDYFLVTGTDFKNGYIDWNNCVFVEKLRFDQDKYIQLREKDVLVTKDGTIGKVAYINKLLRETTLNSGVFVLRPKKQNDIENQFVYYILMSFYFDEYLNKITAGSTITHLYQKDFVHFNLILPPLPEQKAIAEALSDTDAWIDSLEQLIAKKRLIKQGAMQDLLRPKEGWELRRLGEIGEVKMCKRVFNFQTSEYGEIPFYKIGTFGQTPDAFITKELFAELKNKFSYPNKGDILISAAGTIGRTVVFDGSDSYFQDSNIVWISNNEKIIGNSLLKYVLKTVNFNTEGGTIQRLYNSILKNTLFYCPPMQEQIQIATILSDIDSELDNLENQLIKARQIKQGMMQDLLTGRIRLI
jgi:type I restriction enzyme S subunit